MKSLFSALIIVFIGLTASTNAQARCTPKFINPITDVCWTCIFPITVFGLEITPTSAKTKDDVNVDDFFCACTTRVGIPVSFWEPVRSVDVVKDPYCFLNLGFEITDVDFLPYDLQGNVTSTQKGDQHHSRSLAFMHVHYYTNPMLYWLELLLEDPCLERGGFDLSYLTEADPTWVDPELAGIFNPDAFLYGNILAVASCTADCVASTAGFPINAMHWCSGCQGPVYPLTGFYGHHYSGVSTSSVLMHRMLTKAHRLGGGMAFGTTGEDALCGYYPRFMIEKSMYRFQLTHPIPQDKRITGKCCQHLGSSSTLYEVGKNLPMIGEDFGYLMFRKRDCCSAVIDANSIGGGN